MVSPDFFDASSIFGSPQERIVRLSPTATSQRASDSRKIGARCMLCVEADQRDPLTRGCLRVPIRPALYYVRSRWSEGWHPSSLSGHADCALRAQQYVFAMMKIFLLFLEHGLPWRTRPNRSAKCHLPVGKSHDEVGHLGEVR